MFHFINKYNILFIMFYKEILSKEYRFIIPLTSKKLFRFRQLHHHILFQKI